MSSPVSAFTQERVQGKVWNARARGSLKVQPCEVCGATNRIHAHHEDYSKPLEVKWLCSKHHRERHKELGAPLVKSYTVRVTLDADTHRALKLLAIDQRITLKQLVLNVLSREAPCKP